MLHALLALSLALPAPPLAFPFASPPMGAPDVPRASINPDSIGAIVNGVADEVARVLPTADARAARFSPGASPAQLAAFDAHVDRWLHALRSIDAATIVGRQEWVTHGVLRDGLESIVAGRACRATSSPVPVSCYEALLRARTTLPLTADSVLRRGAALRASLDAELSLLSREALGTADVDAARRRMRSDSTLMTRSREELMRLTEDALARAKARIADAFHHFPIDTLLIVPEPPEREATAGAPARYVRRAGATPAQFVLNLYKPEDRPRMLAYTAAVHEGFPGHHLQNARMRQGPRHPALSFFPVTGFIEGWGLYAERLADEMAVYPTTLDRAWYVTHLTDAAIGMQLDPQLNLGTLTRAQAIDTMMIVSGRPRWEAENYATRHLTTPAQIVTYAIGYAEILRLRELARRRLGDRFSIRDFHERVLEDGEVTLPMLAEKIARWIATTERR